MLLKKLYLIVFLALLFPSAPGVSSAKDAPDAEALVKKAIDYYRGTASTAKVVMTIHRPDWERTMTIEAWTKGTKDSLFFITAPAKDKGNGTLKKGREMWTYNPKVNRVIKLPPSMMSQAWMGSDFSNNDLAKSDSIIDDYNHTLESVKESDGHKVYVIRSVPKPAAPVVWGMQRLYLRDDRILLREEFFDEDRQLVKAMTGSDIKMLGGRLFPRIWRMQKADVKDEYTQLEYRELEFLKDLPARLFTITSLKTQGR